MTGKTGNGASERQLIEHVLGVIKERLVAAKVLSESELRDAEFLQRRLNEVVEDLQSAHDTIADLTHQLYGSEDNPVPVQLRHALRSHGSGLQPVRLDLGGIPRILLIPQRGYDDPVAEAQLWRQLRERYGESGA
ncbi:hypothetical protein [Nonomuraea sp. WAC 01424]|uniref:hypothetical protein n=1 Tax=Nonomuraea sp. WAC 01424 TaxID=2203200 RepID=UPI000F783ECF|nr:hypothetical protein [Nonomuraea sp. WAC 01424]